LIEPDTRDDPEIPVALADNSAWVSVGIDHETSVFAVATIEKWWQQMGEKKYPGTRRILHHGRWGWVERAPAVALEARTRAIRCGDWTGNRCLPLPARHQ